MLKFAVSLAYGSFLTYFNAVNTVIAYNSAPERIVKVKCNNFLIFSDIGFMEVIAKSILLPIFTELTYYSVIVITRIPFGRITNSIAIGVYIVCIL